MSIIKWLAVNCLPSPILFWVKKLYYTRVIASFWEPDVAPIEKLVKAGDYVIDLGANIGWYTHVLAKLAGEHGKVYSIEPIPDTFRLLSAVATKRRLKNVELFNVAISSKDGSVVMEIPLHDYGGKNFYMAKIVSGTPESVPSMRRYTVESRSLDSLFQAVAGKVSFIKCDVEGHELAAVHGASKFFQEHKPALMMEVAGRFENEGTPANELYRALTGYGYKAFIFDGTKMKERPVGHWAVNYFFLQPPHLSQLGNMVAQTR